MELWTAQRPYGKVLRMSVDLSHPALHLSGFLMSPCALLENSGDPPISSVHPDSRHFSIPVDRLSSHTPMEHLLSSWCSFILIAEQVWHTCAHTGRAWQRCGDEGSGNVNEMRPLAAKSPKRISTWKPLWRSFKHRVQKCPHLIKRNLIRDTCICNLMKSNARAVDCI